MKNWLLNIVVTSLALSFVRILLPSGKFSKIIRTVCSLVVITVAISPIISLNATGNDFISIPEEIAVDADFGLITDMYRKQIEYLANEKRLNIREINISTKNDSFIVEKLDIVLVKEELSDFQLNNNVIDGLVDEIYSCIAVERGAIKITYE